MVEHLYGSSKMSGDDNTGEETEEFVCLVCGTTNSINAKRCRKCTTPFDADDFDRFLKEGEDAVCEKPT